MKMPKFLITGVAALAVVSTAASSFAHWDTLEATSAAKSLIINKPVVVTMAASEFTTDADRDLGTVPTYSTDVSFNAENITLDIANKDYTVELVPTVKSSGMPVDTSKYDIAIKKSNNALTLVGGKYTDTITAAANTYKVEVTPKESVATDAAVDALTWDVEVTANLSATAKAGA